jgi:hypothetical protein
MHTGNLGPARRNLSLRKRNTGFKVEQNAEADLGILWESKSLDVQLSVFNNHIMDYIYIAIQV